MSTVVAFLGGVVTGGMIGILVTYIIVTDGDKDD